MEESFSVYKQKVIFPSPTCLSTSCHFENWNQENIQSHAHLPGTHMHTKLFQKLYGQATSTSISIKSNKIRMWNSKVTDV